MTAPMLRRPRLRVPVFAQRDGTVRLGWHPERSFVATPPPDIDSDTFLDLLRRLDGVHSRAHTVWYAGTVGMNANAMSTLLAELADADLLAEGNVEAGGSPPVTVLHIIGRGPLSDAVSAALTPTVSLTVERSATAPGQLVDAADDARWVCDVAVLTDDMAPDPRLITGLNRTRTPHIQVRMRDGVGVVGPFVLPGVTSCLRCADLVRCGRDTRWPHVSAQLLGRVGAATRPSVLATAAVALAHIDAFVQERRTPLADTTIEIDLTSHAMNRRVWPRHRLCDCSL